MQLMRALRLSSASTTNHGDSGVSVWRNMASFALEQSDQRCLASRSIGLIFQRRRGSCRRLWNRRSCSSSLTENQYLTRMIPSSINWCSKTCLLYTSDAADEEDSVDLGGRRIIKKKKKKKKEKKKKQ